MRNFRADEKGVGSSILSPNHSPCVPCLFNKSVEVCHIVTGIIRIIPVPMIEYSIVMYLPG